MRIIANNHWRDFIYGCDLPESVRADFDYMDSQDLDDANFIKYRGHWYHLGEFMHSSEMPPDWHGYASDSFFSGVLIRISDDCEQYQIATYLS